MAGLLSRPLSNNGVFAKCVWREEAGDEQHASSLRWFFLHVVTISKVLLVEDELDVGLGVAQTLFLQRVPEPRRATQEHSHFSSTRKQRDLPSAVRLINLLCVLLKGSGGRQLPQICLLIFFFCYATFSLDFREKVNLCISVSSVTTKQTASWSLSPEGLEGKAHRVCCV